MPNGHIRAPSDGVSISSTNSSSTMGGKTEIEPPPAPVADERSALLSEIRIGDCKSIIFCSHLCLIHLSFFFSFCFFFTGLLLL
jgi:hypothetical protein